MRQRASLVRAFAFPSDVLLLDEALSAVDIKVRIELLDLLRDYGKKKGGRRYLSVMTYTMRCILLTRLFCCPHGRQRSSIQSHRRFLASCAATMPANSKTLSAGSIGRFWLHPNFEQIIACAGYLALDYQITSTAGL